MASLPDSSDNKINFQNFLKINGITNDKSEKDTHTGLAVVVGIQSYHGPQGTAADVETISNLFKNDLNFLVWSIQDPTTEDLEHVISSVTDPKLFPKHHCTVFYYAGHGGSDADGSKYIKPYDENEPEPYYIQELIISKFRDKKRHLFFFDCCLSVASGEASASDPSRGGGDETTTEPSNDIGLFIPSDGAFLVAYATSHGEKAKGSTFHGGKWTHLLCENIKKYDLPITTILDKTWNDLFQEGVDELYGYKIQKPHYVSSVGLLSLRDPTDHFERLFQQSEKSISDGPAPPQKPIVIQQNYRLKDILKKTPLINDLKAAMKHTGIEEGIYPKDQKDWHWFGKLLNKKILEKAIKNRSSFNQFLERALQDRPNMSWQDVVNALTQPSRDSTLPGTPVGGKVTEDGKGLYDKLLRAYLAQPEVKAIYGPKPDAVPS